MLRKKIDLGNNLRQRNIAQFVNRTGVIQELISTYRLRVQSNITEIYSYVINYYGIGGIGKSRLASEIRSRLKDTETNYCFFPLDFKDNSIHNMARALLRLRTSYIGTNKISFRHFDIAYAIYFVKKNPDFTFNEKTLPFLEEAGIATELLGLIDSLGFAGSVTSVSNWLYKQFNNKYISSSVRNILEDMPNKTIIEIEDYLLALFSFDIEAHFTTNHTCLPVFFFDTYEHIISMKSDLSPQLLEDDWVRELVISVPFAMFLITGRNQLNWKSIDNSWAEHLHFRLIENLSQEDSISFLVSTGITNAAVICDIFDTTSGHPYYLDLCVDTYYESILSTGTAENIDFKRKKSELYSLFSETINRNLLDFLKVISIGSYCSDDLYFFIAKELNIPISFPQYVEIERFSFIQRTSEKVFIHDLMKESLEKNIDARVFCKSASTLMNYYNEKLISISNKELTEQVEDWLLEALIISKKSISKDDLLIWANTICLLPLRRLQLGASSQFLIDFISQVESIVLPKKLTNKLVYIKIDMVHIQGRYQESVDMLKDLLKEYSEDEILNNDEITYLELRKVHHQMMFMPVKPLIERIKWILTQRKNKKTTNKVYVELLFMLYGNLGALGGNLLQSRKGIIKTATIAQANNDVEMTCRTFRKLADYLKERNHLNMALKIVQKAINMAKDNGLERYLIYLNCTHADILKLKGEIESSIELFETTRQMAISSSMNGWIGHCNLGKATAYLKQGDIETSMTYLLLAENYYQRVGQAWGKLQVCIIKTKIMKMRGDIGWDNHADVCLSTATVLGYSYEQKICEMIKSEIGYVEHTLMYL